MKLNRVSNKNSKRKKYEKKISKRKKYNRQTGGCGRGHECVSECDCGHECGSECGREYECGCGGFLTLYDLSGKKPIKVEGCVGEMTLDQLEQHAHYPAIECAIFREDETKLLHDIPLAAQDVRDGDDLIVMRIDPRLGKYYDDMPGEITLVGDYFANISEDLVMEIVKTLRFGKMGDVPGLSVKKIHAGFLGKLPKNKEELIEDIKTMLKVDNQNSIYDADDLYMELQKTLRFPRKDPFKHGMDRRLFHLPSARLNELKLEEHQLNAQLSQGYPGWAREMGRFRKPNSLYALPYLCDQHQAPPKDDALYIRYMEIIRMYNEEREWGAVSYEVWHENS